MNIAEKLYNYRKENGLTQADFGERIGISPKVISKWENKESLPSIEVLPKIADCLGISVDSLLDRKAPNNIDACKTVNEYFRMIPSSDAVTSLQNIISYALEGIEYKHSCERGWYKSDVLAEIDREWLDLIKNKDPRPQLYYDNRQMLEEFVVNIDNDKLKFSALQSFRDNEFSNILDKYESFLTVFKVLSVDGADKMLKYLFSKNAPSQLTAEHLSLKTGIDIQITENFLISLYRLSENNLAKPRKVCVNGIYHTIYQNPVTNKLQLLITSAYFITENWGGER